MPLLLVLCRAAEEEEDRALAAILDRCVGLGWERGWNSSMQRRLAALAALHGVDLEALSAEGGASAEAGSEEEEISGGWAAGWVDGWWVELFWQRQLSSEGEGKGGNAGDWGPEQQARRVACATKGQQWVRAGTLPKPWRLGPVASFYRR